MRRANRVVVKTNEAGVFDAVFYKTHEVVGTLAQGDWKPSKDAKTKTAQREEYRMWAISHAEDADVDWKPDYQAQSWDRKYWKYETDEQVAEDASTLMSYTIRKICEGCGLPVKVTSIELDSIVPMESPLSYVEHGKYTKSQNWAVATVNLEVQMTVDGADIDIIYPIEMRSGQLTKIKLTKSEVKAMVEDSRTA